MTHNKGFDFLKDEENESSLNILDSEQMSAVRYQGDKPLVINVGPGSGKTRILVEKIVYLIEELNIDPSTILLITSSHKAAYELQNRLKNDTSLSIDVVNQIRIDTILGLCKYLIMSFANLPYNYLNSREQRLFLYRFKKELGFDNYAFLYDNYIPKVLELYDEFFNCDVDINGLINHIESRMNRNVSMINHYEEYIDEFHRKYGHDQFPNLTSLRDYKFVIGYYYHIFLAIAYSYSRYRELLEQRNICDFNLRLEKAYEILQNHHLTEYLRYRHILIDEFQGIDFYQMKIFKMLQEICINNGGSFTIIGDSDQRIYDWRGSSSTFFEDCLLDPNFEVITIHNNYRSSANIVEFSEGLINDYQIIKKVSNPVNPAGSPVFYLSSSKHDEARNVVQLVKRLKEEKKIMHYSDVALVFKSNSCIENFVKILDEFEVPFYSLNKRNDFLNKKEVFDKVNLMTMDMANELEYPAVILCSLEDAFFLKSFVDTVFRIPSYLKGNKPLDIEKNIFEEEMRSIHVATTSARDLLILSLIANKNQLPVFLEFLQSRNVKIMPLQSHDLNSIQKIS